MQFSDVTSCLTCHHDCSLSAVLFAIFGTCLIGTKNIAKKIAVACAAKQVTQCWEQCASSYFGQKGQSLLPSIAPARGQTPKCLKNALQGDDLWEEFKDTQIVQDSDKFEELLANCTQDARDLIQKCPVFVFGRARQGKSTLINDLLQLLGHEKRPATEDNMRACTKGVQTHRWNVQGWTTPGVDEELVLFDTEGWELGRQAVNLLDECIEEAKKQKIPEEVLRQRLVLVLVLESEFRHEIHDEKFKDLIKEVCDQAKAAADKAHGGKPVLLPIVSKMDLFTNEQIKTETGTALKEMLDEKVGDNMNVENPIFLGRETKQANKVVEDEHFNRPCIVEFKETLSKICKLQLGSEDILRAVLRIMEDKLMEELQKWEKKGIDSNYSLIRRFLWLVARHRNLRVKDLYSDEHCLIDWDGAHKVADGLRNFESSPDAIEGMDDWHIDPLRRKHQSANNASGFASDDQADTRRIPTKEASAKSMPDPSDGPSRSESTSSTFASSGGSDSEGQN